MYVRVKMVPPVDRRDEALRLIRSLVGPTSAAPGCIDCGYYVDAQNENVLGYFEEWQTEEDLRRHIRSDDYRKFLALVDLSAEPPDLQFHRVCETLGMDFVRTVRQLAR